MSFTQISLIIYGVLLLAGSFIGWKAGSTVSLIMGLISGAVILVGVFISLSKFSLGISIAGSMSVILCIVFLIRLIKTAKFMPSGMLLALSIIAAVISLSRLFKN